MVTDLKTSIAKLNSVLPKLSSSDRTFALSLIKAHNGKWGLSPNQLPWVDKLIDRAEKPKSMPPSVSVGSFEGVVNLFKTAKLHLKWPKIVLSVMGKTVKLSLAGPMSKTPGSINVAGEGSYPDRAWYGRVSPEGAWVPGKMDPAFKDALAATLTKLGEHPARVAKEYGKLTGNCCFCNLTLTDKRSTAAGFGPVCADHFGLADEWKHAANKAEAMEEVASATSSSVPAYEDHLMTVADVNIELAKPENKDTLDALKALAAKVHNDDYGDEPVGVSVMCYLCEKNPAVTEKFGKPLCADCAKGIA